VNSELFIFKVKIYKGTIFQGHFLVGNPSLKTGVLPNPSGPMLKPGEVIYLDMIVFNPKLAQHFLKGNYHAG